jgi:DUF4097 and DUF4098 domain-containing protein YvlB
MRFGIVLIVSGVLLFLATTPNSAWLTQGVRIASEVGTNIDGRLVRGGKTITQSYDLSSINRLQLETYAGDIEIEVGDMSSQGSFKLEAVGHRELPSVVRDGGTLKIIASRQLCNNCLLHYRIKLGKAMHLDLSAANGGITVSGLTNSLLASNQNGDIELSDLGKTTLQLDNQNGQITVTNATLVAGSQNRIENQNGEIGLHNLSGEAGLSLQASAQNGNVDNEIGDTTGNNPVKLEVSTQNGSISLTKER